MMPLEHIEEELRKAVQSRRYREVERLLVVYCDAARARFQSLAPSDPGAREIQRAVEQLLEWTGRMLRAGRESIALELNRLPRVKHYLQTPPVPVSTWHVEG